MSTSFPIFGANGREGDLSQHNSVIESRPALVGQMEALRLPIMRDAAAEAQRGEERYALYMQVYGPPGLFAAQEAAQAARVAEAEARRRYHDLGQAVIAAHNGLTNASAEMPGLREERRATLQSLECQRDVAGQQLDIATEQVRQCVEKMLSITQVKA